MRIQAQLLAIDTLCDVLLRDDHAKKRMPSTLLASPPMSQEAPPSIGGKVGVALCIFVVGFSSAIAPLYVAKSQNDTFFSVGNMMTSGVLLAAALVHQLTDAVESLNTNKVEDGFPFGPFICGLTFILFMIFEEMIHLYIEEEEEGGRGMSNGSHDHDHQHEANIDDNQDEQSSLLSRRSQHHSEIRQEETELLATASEESTKMYGLGLASVTCSCRSVHYENIFLSSLLDRSSSIYQEHHHHENHIAQHLHGSLFASIGLLLALSAHSILEGLAIGVAARESVILTTTMAVFAHKAFAGYALGASMVTSSMKRSRHILFCVIFAACTPIGVFMGITLNKLVSIHNVVIGNDSTAAGNDNGSLPGHDDSASNGGDIAAGVFQAAIAGTFLYISIVEIGMKELMSCRQGNNKNDGTPCDKKNEVAKLVAFLFGFLAMSSLAIYV